MAKRYVYFGPMGDFNSSEVYEITGESRLEPSGEILYTLRTKEGREFPATEHEVCPTNGPVMRGIGQDNDA